MVAYGVPPRFVVGAWTGQYVDMMVSLCVCIIHYWPPPVLITWAAVGKYKACMISFHERSQSGALVEC